MEKLYDRIDWHNNTTPALNETNLNRMSKSLDDLDDRVVDIAGTVMETVPQIQEDLAEAQELIEDAEELTTHPPIIGQNGHWWTWDTSIDDYSDSGVDAGVSLTIGTTSTLTPGSDATVTNSGTATDPILNFGIPQGAAGQNGQDGQDGTDGQDGVSPEVTIRTITGGHSVTITDADHPAGQSFNVMDGTNGQGIPTSGTTGQVLTKASNADYDTTWTTPSGGSGGHTIINSSGTSMTQRTGLQFEGMGVTDDSTNDRTKVKLPIFNGTTAQWTALSSTEKAKYSIVNLTDDYGNDWEYVGTFTGVRNPLSIPSDTKYVRLIIRNVNVIETPVIDGSITGSGLRCAFCGLYDSTATIYKLFLAIDTGNWNVQIYNVYANGAESSVFNSDVVKVYIKR